MLEFRKMKYNDSKDIYREEHCLGTIHLHPGKPRWVTWPANVHLQLNIEELQEIVEEMKSQTSDDCQLPTKGESHGEIS